MQDYLLGLPGQTPSKVFMTELTIQTIWPFHSNQTFFKHTWENKQQRETYSPSARPVAEMTGRSGRRG